MGMRRWVGYPTLLFVIITLGNGCVPIKQSKIVVDLKNKEDNQILKITISNIKVVDNQIILTGTNLSSVTTFKIKEGSQNTNLQIESKTSNSLIANTISNVTFAAGKVFDFILSSAHAASTFTVDFSLCDSSLGGKAIDCLIAPTDKQVLSFDQNSNSWKPRSVNGLSYKGVWNSLPSLPGVGSLMPGDYYIVGTAQGFYNVGDWIVLNDDGVTFEQIENSTSVLSVFGRNNNVVAQENDYHLDLLGDVDLSDGVTSGDTLIYDGTKWIAGVGGGGGGGGTPLGAAGGDLAGTYPNPTIGSNRITDSHIANAAISQTKINGLATSLSGKEGTITAATTADYYRGDKTFAPLSTSVVPEGSNLYFTNARVLGIALTGFNNALTGPVTATDTMLQAFGRVQNQISSLTSNGSNFLLKNAPDTLSDEITLTGVIDASVLGDIKVNGTPAGLTSAVSQSYVNTAVGNKLDRTTGGTVVGSVSLDTDLKLKASGNTNYVTLRAHATSGVYNFVLPSAAGTAGQVLSTDGSGNTTWIGAGGTPSGSAGGDLAGTYPNPTIGSNRITDSHIANAAISQVKINGLATALSGKEGTITATTSADYYRGDKTFATLNTSVVPEGSNLYFTNARVLGIALTGFNNALTGPVTATDTMLQAFGRVQNQISSLTSDGSNFLLKNAPDTLSDEITLTGVIDATTLGDIKVNGTPAGLTSAVSQSYVNTAVGNKLDRTTGGTVAGSVSLDTDLKLKASGNTNYVTLRAHATSGVYNFVLPSAAGTAGQVLSTDGSGNTTWIAAGGVPSGSAGGDLAGTYPNPTIGSNRITDSHIANAAISQTKINGLATSLSGKEGSITATTSADYYRGDKTFTPFANSVWATVLTGLSTATSTAVTAADTVLVALGKLQAQTSNRLIKNAADTISGPITLTGTITTSGSGNIIVADTPLSNSSAVNKTYADGKLDRTAGGTVVGSVSLDTDLKLKGSSNTNYVTLRAHATTSAYNFVLPSSAGTGGQVLSTDGSGNTSWLAIPDQPWTVTGSNVSRATGNVGIGTATPGTNTRLNVNGQITAGSSSITTGTIDFVDGNSVTTTFDCNTNLTLRNIRIGGNYLVVVTGAGTNQCNFNTAVTDDDAATVAYRFAPINSPRAANTHTVYSLSRVGNTVYVSWITGF